MQQNSPFYNGHRDYQSYFSGIYVFTHGGDRDFLPKQIPLYSEIRPDDDNEKRRSRLDFLAKRANSMLSNGSGSSKEFRGLLRDLEFWLDYE